MARLWLWAAAAVLALHGCTNDYGKFRFPRPAADSGADAAAADGGDPDGGS